MSTDGISSLLSSMSNASSMSLLKKKKGLAGELSPEELGLEELAVANLTNPIASDQAKSNAQNAQVQNATSTNMMDRNFASAQKHG